MKVNQVSETTPASKLLTYLGVTVTLHILGLIATFVYSSYFNRSNTFAESFLFRSSDKPPIPLGFPEPKPLGIHYFGDYLWVYAQIKQSGLDGYFGVSQLFLLAATKLTFGLSFVLFLAISISFMIGSARFLLNKSGFPSQLALLSGAFLITQPVLLAIDRGQLHLLLFGLLLLGLTLSTVDGKNSALGAVLIGAAISTKLTPMFFVLLYVRNRQWKELKISLFSLVVFLILPFAYLRSGIGALKYMLGISEVEVGLRNLYNSSQYFIENTAYNNSFKGLWYFLSQFESSLGGLGGFLYNHYLIFAGVTSMFLVWLILQQNVSQFESTILMAISTSLLIPIASGYTLMLFALPLVVILADHSFCFSRENIFYTIYIGIVLMPKQIALGFETLSSSSFTLGSVLNPSISLCVIVYIAGKQLPLSWFRQDIGSRNLIESHATLE